jgi:site-specific recombinase XerD
MARKYLLTWEPATKRWRKMHKGKVYVISCKALDCPPTKEGSYLAANQWWEHQFTKIKEPVCRFDYIIEELERRKSWMTQQGLDSSGMDKTIQMVRDMAGEDLHPSIAEAITEPNAPVWQERLSQFKPIPDDRTVGHWVAQFLLLREADVAAKQLSSSSFDTNRLCLEAFSEWCGHGLPIENLDANRWIEWYKVVQSSNISVSYKKKRFMFVKTFISWLIERELIPSFPSLYSRRYKFAASDKEVKSLPVDQVREIVEAASGILRLHLLLMLNCGFTQKDISDLKPDEYRDGRITRRRSKTSKRNTRVVSWKLWDCTRDLLDQYKRDGADHLLLTSSGKTWIQDAMIAGKRRKTDNIRALYEKLHMKVPLRRLRQTSGDMVMHQFGKHIGDHFLAHGTSVVDAAYFSRDQNELDQAIEWLGKTYNLE